MRAASHPLLLTEQELEDMRFTLAKLNELRAHGLLTSTLEPHRERLQALLQEAPLLRDELATQLRKLDAKHHVRSVRQITFATEPDPNDREQMAIVLCAGLRESGLPSVVSPDGLEVQPVWSGNAMNYVPRWLADALRPRLAPALNERRLLVCEARETLTLTKKLRAPIDKELRETRLDLVELYPDELEKVATGLTSETLVWIVERTTSIALLTAWFLRANPKDGLYRSVRDELGELARKRLLANGVRTLSPADVRTAKRLFTNFEVSAIDRDQAAADATAHQLKEWRELQDRKGA